MSGLRWSERQIKTRAEEALAQNGYDVRWEAEAHQLARDCLTLLDRLEQYRAYTDPEPSSLGEHLAEQRASEEWQEEKHARREWEQRGS